VSKKSWGILSPVLIVGLALATSTAIASPIVFSGTDPGANDTDPRPNSNATAASFDAAASGLGTLNIITFESSPVGAFTNLEVAPGVFLSGTAYTGVNEQLILNAPYGDPDSLFGYNTTSGGANFAFINGGFLTFTFSTPTSAFGAYITGLQLNGETIDFNDGTAQSITIPNVGSGAEFVGFTDAGASISSVTINTTSTDYPSGDYVGVDDVRYVSGASSSTVPEPGSLILMASGLAALALLRRRVGV